MDNTNADDLLAEVPAMEARAFGAAEITPDLDAAIEAGKQSEARAFGAADAATLPRTTKGAAALFESGAPAVWFAALPERIKAISSWELLHSYKEFLARVQIARNLETRADELAALSAQIKAQGFTVADLVAFERQTRGQMPFGYNVPDYVLPPGYRATDLAE